MKRLYDFFMVRDCELVKINPLITTKDGKLYAANSKVTIDDNVSFRQKELADSEDYS
jgi:succinyl-CoA synthetase beta subunit